MPRYVLRTATLALILLLFAAVPARAQDGPSLEETVQWLNQHGFPNFTNNAPSLKVEYGIIPRGDNMCFAYTTTAKRSGYQKVTCGFIEGSVERLILGVQNGGRYYFRVETEEDGVRTTRECIFGECTDPRIGKVSYGRSIWFGGPSSEEMGRRIFEAVTHLLTLSGHEFEVEDRVVGEDTF